jgi:ABC-type nitrate/sulfonate/bicarbonate transport system substrate-binding protein
MVCLGRYRRIHLLAALVAGLLATLASLRASAEPMSVRFVYDWPVADFGMVPMVVAQQRGLYQKHGLKVDLLFPPDAQTTARMLATGRADIGFEAATDLVFAANQGVPIVAIANFTRSNSWCLIGRPGEPIVLTQLKGKSVGIFTDSWTRAMMAFVVKKAGLREGEIREITTQNDDIPLLLAGKIDLATNSAGWGVAEVMDHLHRQPTLACNADIGVPNIPVWAITAANPWLQTHGAAVQAWLAALAEAIDWSVAHPAEAAQVFTHAYPSAGSLNYNVIGWSYTAHLMNGPGGYFKQDDEQWRVLAGALRDTGQIAAVKPPSVYYTNAYVPK